MERRTSRSCEGSPAEGQSQASSPSLGAARVHLFTAVSCLRRTMRDLQHSERTPTDRRRPLALDARQPHVRPMRRARRAGVGSGRRQAERHGGRLPSAAGALELPLRPRAHPQDVPRHRLRHRRAGRRNARIGGRRDRRNDELQRFPQAAVALVRRRCARQAARGDVSRGEDHFARPDQRDRARTDIGELGG
jgi:hypothetical protein